MCAALATKCCELPGRNWLRITHALVFQCRFTSSLHFNSYAWSRDVRWLFDAGGAATTVASKWRCNRSCCVNKTSTLLRRFSLPWASHT
eukprot:4858965-Amphidinium_carterae.2